MKAPSYILIGIVLGAALGGGGVFTYLSPQIKTLQNELQTEKQNYDALFTEKTELQTTYDNLQTTNEKLQSDYRKLQNEKTSLQTAYNTLQTEKNTIANYLSAVSGDLSKIKEDLDSYGLFEDSLKRTLNNGELDKIGDVVNSIMPSSTNSWSGRDAIYNYIVNNIEYNYDTEFVYFSNLSYQTINGKKTYTGATLDLFCNFVQTPEYTINEKRGDCEDQAILEYAMIMYYYKNIYGTTYSTYLADIEYATGPGHIAVFIPVQGGQLCILDTAGHYRTNRWGETTSKDALTELNNYNTHWSISGHPSITNITLYRVDTTSGTYTIVANGSLTAVSEYLSID